MRVGAFLEKLAGAKSPDQPDEKNTEVRVPASRTRRWSITPVMLVVVVAGASFYMGVMYQKSQQSATAMLGTNGSSQPSQSQNGGLGGGAGSYGRFGQSSINTSQVTAVSGTSITVKGSSGTSETYAITSSTRITDSGQQVSASDIKIGDTVLVLPNRMNDSDARHIIVNPDFSGQNHQPTTVDPSETQLN